MQSLFDQENNKIKCLLIISGIILSPLLLTIIFIQTEIEYRDRKLAYDEVK
jgi:hypothetical protein